MYIINDVAYANELKADLKILSVKIVNDLCLLVTFNTGEQRIFDCYELLQYPVYEPLRDKEVFNKVFVEKGILTWLDGDIDIAPETVYKKSFAYNSMTV